MSNRYSGAELDQAKLRLIDAIPTKDEMHICHPDAYHPLTSRCEAMYVDDYQEIADEVALWPGAAERLLDDSTVVKSFDARGDGTEQYTTDSEHAVGACLLRRALGYCPVYEVPNE